MASPANKRRVAVLGTGIMGSHMARRLAEGGLAVTAWNRTAGKADTLLESGVQFAITPSGACEGVDVAIVMLSNGPVVEEVLFSADRTGKKPAEAA